MRAIYFLSLCLVMQGCYVDKESRYYQAGFDEGREKGSSERLAYLCDQATVKEKQEAWNRGYETGLKTCK